MNESTIDLVFKVHEAGYTHPRAGYVITDAPLKMRPDMPIPRVGETLTHRPVCHANSPLDALTFRVTDVHHALSRNADSTLSGWTVFVTLVEI